MRRKWIETGQDLLIIFLNHLVMIAFGVTAMGILQQDDHMVWLWSVLLVIPLLFYLAKIKICNFFLFYTLHLAVPIGSIFLPIHLAPKFLMIFISIVYFVWSIKIGIIARGHGEGVVGPTAMTGVLGVMFLTETFYSQKGWESIYVAMAIIYAAVYCMYIYISRYLDFLVVNENSAANIPEEEIFNKGFRQSFIGIASVVIFLVVFSKVEWFARVDSWIVSWIGNIFVKIFKSLFFEEAETQEEMFSTMIEQEPSDKDMLSEAGEHGWFGSFFETIILIVGALIVIRLLVYGIRYLWQEFNNNSEKEEKTFNRSIDIRETCTIEKSKKETNNWFSFLNNREKIRKIYRKQVLKNKTAIIGNLSAEDLGYLTARECCDKFSAEQLQKMYEKARYSVEEIVLGDVKAAKSDGK